ncbi:hypothetical protein CPT03_08565 [Pedobacter ginsengisoli]|uniref:Uncharacterized protein n=1 Tax=Pedobacter ginsengisoli TaxID=363852 RepID=A0A2D1U4K1_9SPHI|nr:hypothetical protein CPT03_08565 [Pedobacter ginsengisoli]
MIALFTALISSKVVLFRKLYVNTCCLFKRWVCIRSASLILFLNKKYTPKNDILNKQKQPVNVKTLILH